MERLSNNQLQSFLYDDENNSLDFKSKQYCLSEEDSKSELLKDILAFANSWRDSEAYIVIGIKEIKGKKNEVIGCNDHPDDAKLQQIINYKINNKINLAYEIYELEGKNIGVIRIPKQERPFYSEKDFGNVKKQVVYYRLGSSTASANPQEIYNMGKDDHINNQTNPILDLKFVNANNHEELGTEVYGNIVSYFPPQYPLTDAYKQKKSHNGLYLPEPNINQINRDYWRQLEEYHRMRNLLKPLQFAVTNISDYLAHNIHIEIQNKSANKVIVKSEDDYPYEPSANRDTQMFYSIIPIPEQLKKKNTHISIFNNEWNLKLEIGDIKPKCTVYSDIFFIGATESINLELEPFIYGSNLPNPQNFKLLINFNVEQRPSLTIKDLAYLYEVDKELLPNNFY